MANALLAKINSAPLKTKQDALNILGIDNNPNPSIADVANAYNNLVVLVQPNNNLNEKTDAEKALEIIAKAKAIAVNCDELLTEIAIDNNMLNKNEMVNQDNAMLSQNQLPDNTKPNFYYDLNEIIFKENKGTLVSLQVNDAFKHWMTNLSKEEVITLDSGHQIYLRFKNILAVNNGPNTPGIHIEKTNNNFIACNNLFSDLEIPMRQKNLITQLTALQNAFTPDLSIDVSKQEKQKLPNDLDIIKNIISDHDALLIDTPHGKMCYLNIMCQCAATQYGHNNSFKLEETSDQYKSRLDKIIKVMVKLQQEHQIVGFMLQEAPSATSIGIKNSQENAVSEYFYNELEKNLPNFHIDGKNFSRPTKNTRSSMFSTFDKHIFPTQQPILYNNPGRFQEIILTDKKDSIVTAVNIHGDYQTPETTAELVIGYSKMGSIVGGDLNIVEGSNSYNKLVEALFTIPDATTHIVKAELFQTVDAAISSIPQQKSNIYTKKTSPTIQKEEKSEPRDTKPEPENKMQPLEKSPLLSQEDRQGANVTNKYEHVTNDPKKGRYHFFEVNGDDIKFNLPEELQALKGDHLKSKILEDLKTQIEKASNHVDLNRLLNDNKEEISALKETQGIFSSLFNINTSSIDAFNAMIDERIQQINENESPEPK